MRKYGTSDDQVVQPVQDEEDPQGISRTATAGQDWTTQDSTELAEENHSRPEER